jgi:DNA primase
MDLAQRIKDKIILSDLLGQYVDLRQRGRHFLGLCPFHNEKTPSFTVNNERGIFYCFGCGKHGDAFSFLQEKLSIDFPAALEKLARENDIPLPKRRSNIAKNPSKVLEVVQEIYHKNLPTVLPYLTARGITKETAEAFQLGYSDDYTIKKLIDRGFSRSEIEKSGLAGRGLADRFKNRLIIPIRDRKNRIIGFSGRVLGDETGAKYINSPETPSFQKGFHLYNENQLRYEPVIVTEGYFDAISLWDAGFNAVAIMGTGFTGEQIAILWKYSRKLYIAFDDDAAGKNAIKRSVPQLLATLKPEREVFICNFPEDPDALLQNLESPDHKKKAVEDILRKSRSLDSYVLEEILEPVKNTQSLARRLESIDKYLEKIKNIHVRRAYSSYWKQNLRKKITNRRIPRVHSKEMQVMSIFFYRPELAEQLIETLTKCPFQEKQLEKIRLLFIDQMIAGCPPSQLIEEIRHRFPQKTCELSDFALKIKKTNPNFLVKYLSDLLGSLIVRKN